MIARNILHSILHSAGLEETPSVKLLEFIIKTSAFAPFDENLEKNFRDIWSRNADVISILYTGTGALKTDFTRYFCWLIERTGKRTTKGAINDGKNSVIRYFYGNFFDGKKQVLRKFLILRINSTWPLENSHPNHAKIINLINSTNSLLLL